MKRVSCAVIVTAAGTSARMGGGIKKEYRLLDGVPVLARSVMPFLLSDVFSPIVITIPPGHAAQVSALLAPHVPLGRLTLVEGAETRQKSVACALRALRAEAPALVLIHDGARPWLDAPLVERVRQGAESFGACLPLVEVTQAVKQTAPAGMAETSGTILLHLERGSIRFAQTPQGFAFAAILRAHERAEERGVCCSDDGELYDLFQGPVAWVEGDRHNRKITWPEDMEGQ
jgi:2-C-methyl-D-erythritol 4-phosphate cytidylyltransferase